MNTSKYALPLGEGSLGQKFDQLTNQKLEISLASIRDHLRSTVDRLSELDHPLLYQNLRDATWISERCHVILDSLDTLSESDASLALGAVRYFVVHLDSVPDLAPQIGFEDDRLVMSHVLERLGWTDLLSSH